MTNTHTPGPCNHPEAGMPSALEIVRALASRDLADHTALQNVAQWARVYVERLTARDIAADAALEEARNIIIALLNRRGDDTAAKNAMGWANHFLDNNKALRSAGIEGDSARGADELG